MKHNFRINGEVKTMNFEFGSGILDKHGREIFEGDTVKICGKEYPMEFQAMLGLYEISDSWSDSIEIVNDKD